MVPIFERNNSQALGYIYEHFIQRFREICQEHYQAKRAKAFAFLLYDFSNDAIRDILEQRGGFTKLDRLSGKDLSIFYLHSNNKELLRSFNDHIRYVFDVDTVLGLPMVLFIKFDAAINQINDFKVVVLQQTNITYGFHELYETIRIYVDSLNDVIPVVQIKENTAYDLLSKLQTISIEQFIGLVIQKGVEQIV